MPSRPPLLSEITPSTSGIIQDPQTGDRRVAPSKRADGTLRREIKIRPGYTPQEDVSKYRSARQQESDSRKLPKGSVIGFIRPEPSGSQTALKGMSEAQRKNAKRKEKRKAAATKKEDEDAPDSWDRSSAGSESNERCAADPASQPMVAQASSNTSIQTSDPRGSPNPGKALFQSALKSSSSNPQTPPVQHLVPPTIPPVTYVQNPNIVRKDSSGKGGVKLFASAMQGLDSTSSTNDPELIEKRARALRKKLIQAEQLKARNKQGDSLLPEQLDKISKIDELQAELATLDLKD